MTRRGILIGVALLGLTQWMTAATARDRVWQEGILVSRRTVPAGRDTFQNQFIYRVRGGTARYMVLSDEPLKLDLHVPMRFAVTRRHLIIQDADGSEHKTAILQKLENTPRDR
jgi:hypothetical protein